MAEGVRRFPAAAEAVYGATRLGVIRHHLRLRDTGPVGWRHPGARRGNAIRPRGVTASPDEDCQGRSMMPIPPNAPDPDPGPDQAPGGPAETPVPGPDLPQEVPPATPGVPNPPGTPPGPIVA